MQPLASIKSTLSLISLTMEPIKIFISYAHRDETRKNDLIEYLAPLKREGLISIWDDRAIDAGQEWKKEIDQQLQSARVILLLISHRFINSDFCHNVEMTKAMERNESGEATVIPIILSNCDWSGASFAKLQMLPKDAVPVNDKSWHNPEDAFTEVAKGIRRVVERLRITLNPQLARSQRVQ